MGRSIRLAGTSLLSVIIALAAAASTIGSTTELVDVAMGGNSPDWYCSQCGLSADGRFVVFGTYATNMVPGDTIFEMDIFLRDLQAHTTTRVSAGPSGIQANGGSNFPSISPDGRFVAFSSLATNLLSSGATNGKQQLFIYDQTSGETELVSVSSSGAQGNMDSCYSAISSDGRYVAFDSDADNLVPGDTNGQRDVFVRDRLNKTTERVSVASDGAQAILLSGNPKISADGRCVAFSSNDRTLAPGLSGTTTSVLVHDRQTHTTECVSVASDGTPANKQSMFPSISADGRFVAFGSDTTNLVPGLNDIFHRVFVHDRLTGVTEQISVATDGSQPNAPSNVLDPYDLSISADGRYVGFSSNASNLVHNDTNGRFDIFRRDRITGGTERVNVTPDGSQSVGDTSASRETAMSADGQTFVFTSKAHDLVAGDTSTIPRIYVRHIIPPGQTAFHTSGQQIKFGKWNLVSVPGDPVNADPISVFAGIDVANASLSHWNNRAAGGGYQLYGDAFGWTGPVVRGTPYWLMETGSGPDKDLSFYGDPGVADFDVVIPAHASAPFWIMLGTPFDAAISTDAVRFKNVAKRGDVWLSWVDAYASTPVRIVESNAQGWSAVSNSYYTVTPSTWPGAHQFDPWCGYWLLVTDPSELRIRFPKP